MKVQTTLKVSSSEFYNLLIKRIQKDIVDSTEKWVAEQNLDGFKYIKKISAGEKRYYKISIEIISIIENQFYQLRITSPSTISEHYYHIETITKNSISVTYKEDNKIIKHLDDMFYRFMSRLREKGIKTKALTQLKAMEEEIIENRKK